MIANVAQGATTPARGAALSPYLLCNAFIISLSSLLFGFEIAVISGATDWLKTQFTLNDFLLGFAVASGLIGSIVGSVAVAWPADRFGRRAVLFGLAALFLVASVGCALAWNLSAFMCFRFLGGMAVGGASVVAPVYMAELSPAPYRGRLVTITQLNIVLGILLAYLSNYLIGSLALGENDVRWMFGVMAAPATLFFLLLFLTPQSPRWLIGRGRLDEAREVLQRCGTDSGSLDEEIAEIQRSYGVIHHAVEEPLFQRKYVKPIALAIAVAAFNQLSGINAVLYYSGAIFKMAGADKTSALLQSVLVGMTLLVFTLVAFSTIDRVGRRKLMVAGSVGYIVSLSAVAYDFHTGNGGGLLLASLLLFVAAHALGQGAIIWVFISEIFPNRVRARGQALGSLTHWVMSAAISWSFPVIAATSASSAFAFYAACMVGQLLWVLWVMPETRGVSLEQIQRRLGVE
jgi:SP family xylose:H+ symportor-like MFS transporter